MRVLTLLKMSEQVGEPPAALFEAMDRTIKEIDGSLTLIDTNGLVPSAVAATVIHGSHGKITMVDGPFTESKELIGGYAFVEVETWAEAVEAARKIVAVHTDYWPEWEGSAEVRRVMGPDEMPGA
jgi:hypothetical protein